jgi:hypothetical protein
MPKSPFSKNCKPPKPPILASLRARLSVKNAILVELELITIAKTKIELKFEWTRS